MPEDMFADTDPVKGLHPVIAQTPIGLDAGFAGNGQKKTSRLGGQAGWIGMSLKG